ncbi:hypothetical protein TA5113_01874 [Cognatishimia activa]|nr:hypothetical protein TA5113_01874 [Cognatishimia activa]
MGGNQHLVVVLLQFLVDHVFGLERVVKVQRQHAEAVGDQINRMMVMLDLRKLREDRAVMWIFDMLVQRQNTILLVDLGQAIHEIEQVDVIALFPLWPLETFDNRFDGRGHIAERVRRHKGPKRGPTDHHTLVGQGVQDRGHFAARP